MLATEVLEGGRIRLRPITETDLGLFVEWLSDPDVNRWLALHPHGPSASLDDERRWFDALKLDPNRIAWTIETQGRQPIGTITLIFRPPHQEAAELTLFLGGSATRGHGLGTDAIQTLLRHAFGAMRLHRIFLHTDVENVRAQWCFEKCGFRHEGVAREFRRRWPDGQFINGYVMAVLRHEFQPAEHR
jgi:RimJ/RimL family protein N-acetyltransferase